MLEILLSSLVFISHCAVSYTGPFLWTTNVLAETWVTKAVTDKCEKKKKREHFKDGSGKLFASMETNKKVRVTAEVFLVSFPTSSFI